ncbi:MAG: hypothetical protein KDA37_08110, partial [Planctomycetales bacterium]|nr:hypothetical protein [Planctomycetales bacterium]
SALPPACSCKADAAQGCDACGGFRMEAIEAYPEGVELMEPEVVPRPTSTTDELEQPVLEGLDLEPISASEVSRLQEQLASRIPAELPAPASYVKVRHVETVPREASDAQPSVNKRWPRDFRR